MEGKKLPFISLGNLFLYLCFSLFSPGNQNVCYDLKCMHCILFSSSFLKIVDVKYDIHFRCSMVMQYFIDYAPLKLL